MLTYKINRSEISNNAQLVAAAQQGEGQSHQGSWLQHYIGPTSWVQELVQVCESWATI
jgi:hypothetical protein